eukprot:907697-Rhodomonas_salina.1
MRFLVFDFAVYQPASRPLVAARLAPSRVTVHVLFAFHKLVPPKIELEGKEAKSQCSLYQEHGVVCLISQTPLPVPPGLQVARLKGVAAGTLSAFEPKLLVTVPARLRPPGQDRKNLQALLGGPTIQPLWIVQVAPAKASEEEEGEKQDLQVLVPTRQHVQGMARPPTHLQFHRQHSAPPCMFLPDTGSTSCSFRRTRDR